MPVPNATATPRLKANGRPLTGVQSKAFDHIVRLIRGNPTLVALGASIVIPDDKDFADPAPKNDRPWVRLVPSSGPHTPFCLAAPGKVAYETPIDVEVETRTPGFLWDNSANLGEAAFKALAPDVNRPTFNANMAAHGIFDVEFLKLPEAALPDEVAKGMFRVITHSIY